MAYISKLREPFRPDKIAGCVAICAALLEGAVGFVVSPRIWNETLVPAGKEGAYRAIFIAVLVVFSVIRLAQLVSGFGMLTGKAWSYKLALWAFGLPLMFAFPGLADLSGQPIWLILLIVVDPCLALYAWLRVSAIVGPLITSKKHGQT